MHKEKLYMKGGEVSSDYEPSKLICHSGHQYSITSIKLANWSKTNVKQNCGLKQSRRGPGNLTLVSSK